MVTFFFVRIFSRYAGDLKMNLNTLTMDKSVENARILENSRKTQRSDVLRESNLRLID